MIRYLSFFLLISQLAFVLESLSEDFKNNHKLFKWKIKDNSNSNNTLKWEINEKNNPNKQKNYIEWQVERNSKNLIEIKNKLKKENLQNNDKKNFEELQKKEVFGINPIIPSNNFIEKNNFQSKVEWKSSFGGGAAGGTGQQNNSFRVDYGLSDSAQLTGYFSEADDDTYNKINGERAQYFLQTYALSLKKNIWSSKKLDSSISFLSAIEYLRISSGSEETKSIFNEDNEFFGKDQFGQTIYSFSLPYNKKLTNKLTYSFVPGFNSLPQKLGSKTTRNNFFGNNFYIGNAISLDLLENVNIFGSLTQPLGPGSNHFDKNLNFSRKPIYSFGLNFDLNQKIGIETKLTNGFGATPSTGLLTLPSRNVTLYSASVKYNPYGKDTPLKTLNKRDKLLSYGGISVNNALIPKNGTSQISANIDSKGNYFASYFYSLSNVFQLEILNLGSNRNANDNIHLTKSFTNQYIDENNFNIRVGGKFLLFSPQKKDLLWTSLRTSLGRNESSNQGYILSELINTYRINKWLTSNFNAKYFLSGSQKFGGFGASTYINISDNLQIIPETNFSFSKNLKSNYTIAIRYSLNENKSIDLYTSNALSTQDLGQLLRSKDNRVGIKLNLLY